MAARRLALFASACLFFAGCEREISGPLPQRGYLWQRDWTPATESAFVQAQSRLDGVTILGGEILWGGSTPRFVKSSIRWETVAQSNKPCALALRIAPFPGPFENNAPFMVETATALLAEAKVNGAEVSEFQLDFDCAQKKLAGYRVWVQAVRAAVKPTPLSITTLPSWLEEPAFAVLLNDVDDFVVQVHSVAARSDGNRTVLCDSHLAKTWVNKAAKLGHPFTVALPTYRCLGGYDSDGKLLGVAMDSVQPSWPNGTRVLEFAANADELAKLVADWKRARPGTLQGLIWYRVPTDVDVRNWHWPTLAAVMEGRAPTRKIEVLSEGENPIDVVLVNNGESDEQFAASITASWKEAKLVASDALSGWNVRVNGEHAVFSTEGDHRLRLSPGERRGIGWLRYDRSTKPQLNVAETAEITR